MTEDGKPGKRKPVRKRPVMQSVWFTVDEWSRVKDRMALMRAKDFGAFARAALLEGSVTVRTALDVSALRPELSRIGNNVNQIARQANVEHGVTAGDLAAVRAQLAELQATLDRWAAR